MAEYFVTRHRKHPSFGDQWGISAKTSHGTVAAGTVTVTGDDTFDVRTDAGAKCFRGTDAYDVRVAAVVRWMEEGSQ